MQWDLKRDGKLRKYKCRQCSRVFYFEDDGKNHECAHPRLRRQEIERVRNRVNVNYEMKALYNQAQQDKNKIEHQLNHLGQF